MKTVEEKKHEVRNYYANSSFNILGVSDGAFSKGVEFAQRWINVNDELPKQGDLVLVKYTIVSGYSDITLLELSDDNTWHCRGVDFRRPKAITHWRPIEYK